MLPNIILIGIDNLRFDLVEGCPEKRYLDDFIVGNTLPVTPTLKAVAEESFWFQTCVAAAGYTPPSFATALTGTYPYRHGLIDYRWSSLHASVPTVFEALRGHGYRTVCMGSDPALFAQTRIGRGVDVVCRAEDELFPFLTADPTRPVVAFAHFFDCHTPFLWTDWRRPGINDDFYTEMQHLFGEDLRTQPDDRSAMRRAQHLTHGELPRQANADQHYTKLVSLYLQSIAKFDTGRLAAFVSFLKASGLWDTSYVVFFSDHGEIRDPDNPHLTSHGAHTKESLTRVVLMIHGPGIATGVSNDLVGLVDLTPTLFDLVGIRGASSDLHSLDGRSLAHLVNGESDTGEHWYMQEGWMVAIDRIVPPVRLERAVRTSTDLRYVFRGNEAILAEARGLRGAELRRWIAHSFFPARVEIEADRACLDQTVKDLGGGPEAALELALRREVQTPRHALYDLLWDPAEVRPIRVSFAPQLWPDYLEKYNWMLAHSGPVEKHANPVEESAEAEEEDLAERLRALGYHD